jgi:hypothetical protein
VAKTALDKRKGSVTIEGEAQEWREFTGLTGVDVGMEDGHDTRLQGLVRR